MQFEDKKLTPQAVSKLFSSNVSSIEPYTLMLSPVYVFMKRNEKFVSVKAPLDFFTSEELERLKEYEMLYFPNFVKNSARYQTAARLLQSLFKNPMGNARDIEYSPYEYSNEILKIIAKLWGKQMKIEPFFMAIFTHELCATLKPDLMIRAREKTVVRHDWGLLLSGAFVFIALHLGYIDIAQLNSFRDEIYSRTVEGENWEDPKSEMESIVCELNRLMSSKREIQQHDFDKINLEWAKRLSARLERVKKSFAGRAEASPSIYGEEGFVGEGGVAA